MIFPIDEKIIVLDETQKFVVELKKMEDSNLLNVLEIETKCFPDPWPIKSFEECLVNCECLILVKHHTNQFDASIPVHNSCIMGFFIGSETLDEYTIENVAILPEYQGKGYGFYMISTIIKNHKNKFANYFLDVRKNNFNAINLYKKLGFEPLYERKQYYLNPLEDAIVMRKELKREKDE